MRMMIYGFKPYGSFDCNISEQVINVLPDRKGLVKRVFEVQFDYDMFYQSFLKIKPDIILGLGQHPRARKMRIERKAINIAKDIDGHTHYIKKNSPNEMFVNLKFPKFKNFTTTYNAGTYVCNFSMYIMGEYSESSGAQFGFIHIPMGMELDEVNMYINNTCSHLMRLNE
jgi:pyrrolidone-carboxylate peptidase